MKIYNKLVRDRIPEIIEKKTEIPITRVLSDEEYLAELNIKLQEEVKEYIDDNNVEELTDIVEVIYGILNAKKVSLETFENIRLDKAERRGAFQNKIYLEKVYEKDEKLE